MAGNAASHFRSVLADDLGARGWFAARCEYCSRDYFSKAQRRCGGPECPGTRGLATHSPDQVGTDQRSALAQWQRMHNALARRQVHPFALDQLRGYARDTDLIVSALQYLDPVVHDGQPAPVGIQLLAQPCVRWHSLPVAGREAGVSSSFVNLSSLEVGTPDLVEQVPVHLDHWLAALSAVGIHAREVTIALTDEDCAYGPYVGTRADIHCTGIELGEINWYHQVACADGRRPTVIDFGFAFERIAWAASRTASYHELLSPVFFAPSPDNGVLNDRTRTLALLALSGVTPSSRGPGRYARRIADELALPFLSGVNLRSYVEHSVHFWKQFISGGITAEAAVETVSNAVERQAVAALAKTLNQPPPPAQLMLAEAMEFLTARYGGRAAIARAAREVTLLSV